MARRNPGGQLIVVFSLKKIFNVWQVALRWFTSRSLLSLEGINKELIDRIPGKQTDRKTPLGELNWIFTAITDTIAWNCLPRALFQRLFRQVLPPTSSFSHQIFPFYALSLCSAKALRMATWLLCLILLKFCGSIQAPSCHHALSA